MEENKRRYRNFATVVYPESAPKDWMDILTDMVIPSLISPLHNKDLNKDGTLKKEHYHVMICFEGVKSIEQVRKIFSTIGGVGVEIVNSTRAYARYLIHLDNPNKAQYDIANVITLGGIDYQRLIVQASDKYSLIKEMLDYCVDNEIYSYSQLLMYARNSRNDWFEVLCDTATTVIVQFLKSRYWTVNLNENRNWRRKNGI